MKRFCVVSLGHCGDDRVAVALSEHPDCEMLGRVFADPENRQMSGYELMPQLFAGSDKPVTGFSLTREDAQQRPALSVWGYVRDTKMPVVHVVRRNLFRKILDEETVAATTTGINWHPDDWLDKIRQYEIWDHDFMVLYQSQPYLRIYYEDLLEDFSGWLRCVQAFIGLTPRELPPPTDPPDQVTLGRSVVNLDEVAALLETNGCGWMLAEQ